MYSSNWITRVFSALCVLSPSWNAVVVHAQTCPQVLLDTNDATSVAFRRVNQGIARDLDGLVLVQAFDGNFEVYTGEVGNLECFIFQSGINRPADMNDPNVRFFTFLAPNGLVRTRREIFDPSRNMFVDSGLDPFVDGTIGSETIPYYLILGCDNVLRVFDNPNSSGHPLGTLTPTGNDCNLIPSRPLPTHAPSPSPSESPSRAPSPPSRCEDAVVMVEHQQANVWEPLDLGNGVYLQQMSSGNAAIRRGTSTDGIDSNDEIIWQTCSMFEDSMNYYTTLQEDSHLVTYLPGSAFKFEASWYRDSFMEMDAVGTWQLKLICDDAQNDYEKLQIVDDAGNVAWEAAQLGPQDCSALRPVCPTATVLLQMNEALLSSQATKVAGNGYSLDVEDTAVLNLFQEGCADPVWSGRPSTPVTPGTESPNARITMQNDGNLVMSWKAVASDIFLPKWSTQTNFPKDSSYTFVVDDCVGSVPSVAIYRGNPTLGFAQRIWSETFTPCSGRRDLVRGLRGDSKQ